MRKEVLIAIIIGFVLGLVITFGVWTANKAMKETPQKDQQASENAQETTTPTPTPESVLTITSPEDNFLSDKEKIDVSGKTTPQATVVILFEQGEKIIEADGQGSFTAQITLVGGGNVIKVSSFDQQGKESTQAISVVYSTAEI